MRRAWMPLYAADYLADVLDLSTLQRGAYMNLILHYWLHGGLTGEASELKKISGLSSYEWKKFSPAIAKKFYITFPDAWFHKRIEAEMQRADDQQKSLHDRAMRGVAGRRQKVEHKYNPRAPVLPSPSLSKEDSIPYKDSQVGHGSVPEKRTRPKRGYSNEFEEFWKGYPTDANMSKLKAGTIWLKLTPDERVAATKSLPAFRAYCAKDKTYRPVHAERFLSQARFEGHLGNGHASSQTDEERKASWLKYQEENPW